jgi:RNA polymerase sigma-70 factor (ECF subfamily)
MVGVPQSIAFQEAGLAKQEHAAACDDSFTALVTRQARFAFRVAYSILRNSHDAEDVVQETFLKIYRARNWTSMANERAFLARVVWRTAVDRLPKVPMEPADSEIASTGANPEQSAISGDWTATVHRLMDALPEDLRQTLALHTVEDLSSVEIAGLMGISEGTVRSRLMRARQTLKQKLAAVMAGRHGK